MGATASTGVVMAESTLPAEAASAPTDLELRYTLPAGTGRFGHAVTRRMESEAGNGLAGSFGDRLAFWPGAPASVRLIGAEPTV